MTRSETTALSTDDSHRRAPDTPRPGPLGRLAGLAYRRRGRVLLAWAVALAVAFGLSAAFGGQFTTSASAPGSDSEQAQRLLSERFPTQSGDTVKVVVRADDVTATEVRGAVGALLSELGRMPHVTSVDDPYSAKGSISPDGRTLIARVYLDVTNPNDMPVKDIKRLLAAADAAERDGLNVQLGGHAVQLAEAKQSPAELIGLIAAAVILLVMFGSVVAAGLPLAMAIGALAVSSSLVGLATLVVDIPDFAPTIGVVLGIALGIDYALLMVTRFREWRAVGLDPEAATVATLDTAGRSVLVAGGTVLVSMLGLFTVGLSIMNGTAVVAMLATGVVMAAALTLFPALLGYLGQRIDRLRIPLRRRRATQLSADGHLVPAAGWLRWSGLVRRHSALATVASVALLLVLAVPFLSVHFGLPDEGNDPGRHVEPAGVRPAGRRVRPRRQRSAAGGGGPATRRQHGAATAAGCARRHGGRGGGVPAAPQSGR